MVAGARAEGGFLLWSELSPESLSRLEASADEPATLQALADLLSTEDMDDPLKRAVMLELHLNSLYFARKQGFSSEKTSALFSTIKRNHDEMAEAFLPPHKSWDYFKTILLTHAVQRPPHSFGIFSRREANLITQFVLDTYYRHFKLYRYAFTMRHIKNIDVRTSWLELPCDAFPALTDGVAASLADAPSPEAQPPSSIEVCRESAVPIVLFSPALFSQMPPIEIDVNLPSDVKQAVEEKIANQVLS
eukprot:1280449-Prymnesium_polylepis.1